MEETGIGRNQPLIPDDEAAKVPQPGKRPFDAPPAAVAPQLAPILMGGSRMVAACGNDRFDSPPGQARSQGVALIASIGAQAIGPFAGTCGLPRAPTRDRVERLLKEGDFRRGRRVQVCSRRRSPRHRPEPSTSCPCPAWRGRLWAPFFRGDKATIDKAFVPAQLLLVIQLGQEGSPELEQDAGLLPLLASPPACARTAIPAGQLAPLGPRPDGPKEGPPTAGTPPPRPSP